MKPQLADGAVGDEFQAIVYSCANACSEKLTMIKSIRLHRINKYHNVPFGDKIHGIDSRDTAGWATQ